MKNYFFILMIAFLGFSCGDEDTLELVVDHDIVGNWEYKEENNSNLTTIASIPRTGNIYFESDNTGRKKTASLSDFTFEWTLINDEQEITIVEDNWAIPAQGTNTYKINRVDKDNFILTDRSSLGGENYSEEVLTLTRVQ